MQFLKRGLMIAGAFALVAMLLTLAAPKRVHAAVATLVQVANTIGNPAVTQDTSKTASQIVNLYCVAEIGEPGQCQNGSGWYWVPAGDNLVITSIIITPPDNASGVQDAGIFYGNSAPYQSFSFRVADGVTTQFTYPSGIVIPSGQKITGVSFGINYSTIYVSGYLTAN